MRVNLSETLHISPLKGDWISAQGFNPGLGNSRQCALKGHANPVRHIGSNHAFALLHSRATFRAHLCETVH